MRLVTRLILVFLCALSACSNKKNDVPSLPDLAAVRANLAFTCVHEADHLPPLDPEADQLFKYGRYLQNKDGPKDFDQVGRFIALTMSF